ncbi:MAG: hypothetical protein ABR512_06305 [Desulfopila sp.]
MQTEYRRIAWNGIALDVPFSWEAKVTGLCHLNFECNFKAVFELRWQKAKAGDVERFVGTFTERYEKLAERTLHAVEPSAQTISLFDDFEIRNYCIEGDSRPALIFLYSRQNALFVVLRLYRHPQIRHPLQQIQSLQCDTLHDRPSSWAIQDFQVSVPPRFELSSYTMKAGFTALHLNRGKTELRLCRLAPASQRLKLQSLEEILTSLLGDSNGGAIESPSDNECFYATSPGLLSQVMLRFKRKKPFRRARLWYDSAADRIFGVFMEDIAPLGNSPHDDICESYEIAEH